MRKNKFLKLIILIGLIIISNILVFKYCNLESESITVSYKLISDKEDTYQLFFKNKGLWSEEQSQKVNYVDINKEKILRFTIPMDTLEIRFDLGNQPSNITMSNVKLYHLWKTVELDMNKLLNSNNQVQIREIQKVENSFHIATAGVDPYITYKVDPNVIVYLNKYKNRVNNTLKLGMCLLINIVLLIIIRKSRNVILLVQELNNNKMLIWSLSKNDFKTKYAGSYLGVFWAFVQPVITVLTYWFVFQVGFRAAPVNSFPFLLWLVVGLVPWFFFSEAIINATSSMIEYSYLVKKVVFKISILPIVKIISALFIHIFFVLFTITLFIIYGYFPTIHVVQILYYTLCTFMLVLGISYATAAVIVFFKDLAQIVAIALQVGVWLTPIMWSYNIVPNKYQWILKINPMYYIVEGYRDSLINHVWAWEKYNQTIYFWIITIAMFGFGTAVFKKLKVHFADVL